jgi:hypothetical protein
MNACCCGPARRTRDDAEETKKQMNPSRSDAKTLGCSEKFLLLQLGRAGAASTNLITYNLELQIATLRVRIQKRIVLDNFACLSRDHFDLFHRKADRITNVLLHSQACGVVREFNGFVALESECEGDLERHCLHACICHCGPCLKTTHFELSASTSAAVPARTCCSRLPPPPSQRIAPLTQTTPPPFYKLNISIKGKLHVDEQRSLDASFFEKISSWSPICQPAQPPPPPPPQPPPGGVYWWSS